MLGKALPLLEDCDPSHLETDMFLQVAAREALQLAPQGGDHRWRSGHAGRALPFHRIAKDIERALHGRGYMSVDCNPPSGIVEALERPSLIRSQSHGVADDGAGDDDTGYGNGKVSIDGTGEDNEGAIADLGLPGEAAPHCSLRWVCSGDCKRGD